MTPRNPADAKPARTPISIVKDVDFIDCERLIAGLRGASDRPLLLANDWKLMSRPGGLAACAQTIISWARSQAAPVLMTHANIQNRDQTLDRLAERPHGMIACMMASTVTERDASVEVTNEMNARVMAQVSDMDRLEPPFPVRGQSLFMMCADQRSRALLRPLYSSGTPAEVRSASEIRDLLEDVIPLVSPRHGRKLETLADDLASVVHELFENTDVHARTNVAGVTYERSVRCLNVAERNMPLVKVDDGSLGAGDVQRYLTKVCSFSRSSHNAKFIEIAVIDSGPGLAARMARSEDLDALDLEREADFTRQCFVPHGTRHSRSTQGLGLPRVMQVIRDLGGLIRVRTGRLALSRAFDPETARVGRKLSEDDTILHDASSGTSRLTPLGRAAGTAVTILIPVNLETT